MDLSAPPPHSLLCFQPGMQGSLFTRQQWTFQMTALQAPGCAEASLGIVRYVSQNALFILGDLSSRETCFPKKIYCCLFFFNIVQSTGQVCQPVEVTVFYGVQSPHRKSIRVRVKFKKSYILRNLDCYSVKKGGGWSFGKWVGTHIWIVHFSPKVRNSLEVSYSEHPNTIFKGHRAPDQPGWQSIHHARGCLREKKQIPCNYKAMRPAPISHT